MSPLLDDLARPLTAIELDRRKALGLIGSGALVIAAAGTLITAIRFLEPNAFLELDTRFTLGRPEDIAVGTVLVLVSQKVYVVRNERGFVALSAICTHLGCMTRYDAEAKHVACPCHGSRFALTGAVTAGPAPRPLAHVSIALERGELVVDSKRVVAQDFILELPA